ncbi:hypothetical protein AGR3A_Cc440033 [Agrobacterium tomkonis CFBP 6623]|uniref:Uncharacterized protein n=1 Tax=Agrobacterium tomkonis CFBP 6623 TaxID=1183432 RepID=A0A1S7QP23_9HYPH|nr:hypothetical protein AGR3A_Cc440033 [Agrobacterium tomkonis CFBP 6623]
MKNTTCSPSTRASAPGSAFSTRWRQSSQKKRRRRLPDSSFFCLLPFYVLALKNKKAGQARPFHPFFVNASTSVVKAFNGLMLQSASIMSTLLSRSGSAVLVNLWLTRSQRHYQNAHLTGFIRNTVEPYIGMRSVLFKTGPFRTVFQKKKAGKNPAFSFMSMTPLGPVRLSGNDEFACGHLARAAILHQLVGELLTVVEGGQTSALNSGDVHEYVLRTVVRLNEAVALGCVEPLYCTSRHNDFLPLANCICTAGSAVLGRI